MPIAPSRSTRGVKKHAHAAEPVRQRAVHRQDGDYVASAGRGLAANGDALLGVDADDDAGGAVDLAVDPDLAVVVDVRLEQDRRAGEVDAVDAGGQLDGDAVPGKRE